MKTNVTIIPGSKATFTLYLTDENGRPVSLSPYSAGNLVFLSCKGVRTVVALTIPGANPDKGAIPVIVSAVQTADADGGWANADIELTSAGPEKTLIPLNNRFEVIPRNAPPP